MLHVAHYTFSGLLLDGPPLSGMLALFTMLSPGSWRKAVSKRQICVEPFISSSFQYIRSPADIELSTGAGFVDVKGKLKSVFSTKVAAIQAAMRRHRFSRLELQTINIMDASEQRKWAAVYSQFASAIGTDDKSAKTLFSGEAPCVSHPRSASVYTERLTTPQTMGMCYGFREIHICNCKSRATCNVPIPTE
jgi:hypothetical protein